MDDLFSGTKAVDQKLKFDEQGLHDWFSKNLSEFGSIEKLNNLEVANQSHLQNYNC